MEDPCYSCDILEVKDCKECKHYSKCMLVKCVHFWMELNGNVFATVCKYYEELN